MDRSERVKICKICTNRKFDIKRGVLCGLTDEVATFENECQHYSKDDAAIKNFIEEENRRKQYEATSGTADFESEDDPKKVVARGANWFYWIAGLSLVNSIAIHSGMNVNFIVGLGITQIIDGIIFEMTGDFQIWGLILNVFFSGVFIIIGYFANRLSKSAFISGIAFYALDSLIFLLVPDFLSIGFHVFALVMIVKGFLAIRAIKTVGEEVRVGVEND